MPNLLKDLRKIRAMLATCWVPWLIDDYKGGHCVWGCTMALAGLYRREPVMRLISAAAERLHPYLRGQVAGRLYGGIDRFRVGDPYGPAVYVNNQLGKDAILACIDDAILHEEMRIMLAEITARDVTEEERAEEVRQ